MKATLIGDGKARLTVTPEDIVYGVTVGSIRRLLLGDPGHFAGDVASAGALFPVENLIAALNRVGEANTGKTPDQRVQDTFTRAVATDNNGHLQDGQFVPDDNVVIVDRPASFFASWSLEVHSELVPLLAMVGARGATKAWTLASGQLDLTFSDEEALAGYMTFLPPEAEEVMRGAIARDRAGLQQQSIVH